MRATAEPRRHPVYGRRVYWATVWDDNERPVFQAGPYRNKAEAMQAAEAKRLTMESDNAV